MPSDWQAKLISEAGGMMLTFEVVKEIGWHLMDEEPSFVRANIPITYRDQVHEVMDPEAFAVDLGGESEAQGAIVGLLQLHHESIAMYRLQIRTLFLVYWLSLISFIMERTS